MSRLKEQYRILDYIFRHESELNHADKWLDVINATYAAAKSKSADVHEVATRRYRGGEIWTVTCLLRFISKSTYYRMLEIFFKLAEREANRIFSAEKVGNRNSDDVL